MQHHLPHSFFARNARTVARDLLGTLLTRRSDTAPTRSGIIVETEAYVGAEDMASHAHRGRTPRTEVLFGPAGIWYIYLVYGMHHQLNIVTDLPGTPAGVLIRAIEPVEGIAPMRAARTAVRTNRDLTNGPGKLCHALAIDRSLNGTSATDRTAHVFISSDNHRIPSSHIIAAPRIGIPYASAWKDKPLRFYIKDNPFVSRR